MVLASSWYLPLDTHTCLSRPEYRLAFRGPPLHVRPPSSIVVIRVMRRGFLSSDDIPLQLELTLAPSDTASTLQIPLKSNSCPVTLFSSWGNKTDQGRSSSLRLLCGRDQG
jgi:hypothetical protein